MTTRCQHFSTYNGFFAIEAKQSPLILCSFPYLCLLNFMVLIPLRLEFCVGHTPTNNLRKQTNGSNWRKNLLKFNINSLLKERTQESKRSGDASKTQQNRRSGHPMGLDQWFSIFLHQVGLPPQKISVSPSTTIMLKYRGRDSSEYHQRGAQVPP